jgi:hypothetical protein
LGTGSSQCFFLGFFLGFFYDPIFGDKDLPALLGSIAGITKLLADNTDEHKFNQYISYQFSGTGCQIFSAKFYFPVDLPKKILIQSEILGIFKPSY